MKGYIAKDGDGRLYLYPTKPFWEDELEQWVSDSVDFISIEDKDVIEAFDFITSDDDPIEVEIEIKRV